MITAEQLAAYLKHKSMPALMLWGPPGVGKSSLVQQAAEILGWPLIDLRLSQLNPVDIRGLPIPDHNARRTYFYPPEELPDAERDGEHGVLFLDELPNAPQDVQKAGLQLVLDRKTGRYCLPEGWQVVAAGNRVVDRAGSFTMIASLANRMCHLAVGCGLPPLDIKKDGIDVPSEPWRAWALRSGIREEVLAYITKMPQNLWIPTSQVAFASSRTWEFVSRIVSAFGSVDKTPFEFIAGCVGDGPAAEFVAFCRVRHQMPDPDAILAGKDVPGPVTPDVSYALCSALAVRLHEMKKKSSKKLGPALENLLKYVYKFAPDFQVLLMKDLFQNAGLATELSMCKGWGEWYRSRKSDFAKIMAA